MSSIPQGTPYPFERQHRFVFITHTDGATRVVLYDQYSKQQAIVECPSGHVEAQTRELQAMISAGHVPQLEWR